MTPQTPATQPAPRGMHVGHVHLRVADLERSIRFYQDVLGLDLMQRLGAGAAFLSVDGYHHHLGLNTWESAGGTPPPRGHTGLYHTAFVYSDRTALAHAVARVLKAGVPLDGAADHGVSEAVYFRDPDNNGLELYWDRPKADWPIGPEGHLALVSDRLDVPALLAEAG